MTDFRMQLETEMKNFHDKVEAMDMDSDYKKIAMASDYYRGHSKRVGVFLSRIKIIADRGNQQIKMDLLRDKSSSSKDSDGKFTYSGIGKSGGFGTYVTLSLQATDEQIAWFYNALKSLRKPMSEIQSKMSARYGIDWNKDI